MQVGTGAYAPGGELEGAGLPPVIVTSWTPEQLELLAANQFSSSLREIMTAVYVMRAIAGHSERARRLLEHRSLQYLTDSQVATAVVNRMGGNASLFPAVKELWGLCKELDCELSFVWQPREHEVQQYADELSKLPDEIGRAHV